MIFDNLLTEFDDLSGNKNYWFLRTMKGKYFIPFVQEGYIGINWDYVTTKHLREKSPEEIKNIIAANERDKNGKLYDPVSSKGKGKITSVYNKIIKFKELNNGDIIVITGNGSKFLAFGIVTDNEIYNEFNDSRCEFQKRRKVHWIKTEKLENLDPIWYKIIFSMHAISNLNNYASFIDKIVSSVFVKDEKAHLVIEVKKEDDINYDSLNGMLQSFRKLTELINNDFQLGEDLTHNSVKLALQSPGTVELIYKNGRSLLIAAILLSIPLATSCSHGEASQNSNPIELQAEKDANLAKIKNELDQNDKLNPTQKDTVNKFAEIHYDALAEANYYMNENDSLVNAEN